MTTTPAGPASQPPEPPTQPDPFDRADRYPAGPANYPVVDNYSECVLDEAVLALLQLRSLQYGDALDTLHALTSLALHIQLCLPDAVADAVDQEYTWTEIAAQLQVAPSTARRRHGPHYRHREVPFID